MTENKEAEVADDEDAAEEVAEDEASDAADDAAAGEQTESTADTDETEADTDETEADGDEADESPEGLTDGDFVKLDYTARAVESEQLVDTTDPDVAEAEDIDTQGQSIEPRVIVVGDGHVFPAVEDDLRGKTEGDDGTVVVPAEEAFGEHDPEEVRTISADKIPEDDRYPGAYVQVEGDHGHIEAIIGGRARVNFNHPLAGDDVEYDYEILEVVEDRIERAEGILGTVVDADLELWIETDEVEEERLVESDEDDTGADDEDAADDEAESDADDEADSDDEDDGPTYETVTVEKESLYIEATPQLTMNQQWMFSKQQVAQDIIDHVGVDRVVIQETIEGLGGGPMGGMMGGMGGLEDALDGADLDDADIDADELVEELEGEE